MNIFVSASSDKFNIEPVNLNQNLFLKVFMNLEIKTIIHFNVYNESTNFQSMDKQFRTIESQIHL